MNYHNSESKRYRYVHQYINDYCSDSLVSLTYDGMSKAIHQFQKDFMKMKELNFSGTNSLNEELLTTLKCFPNLLLFKWCEVGTIKQKNNCLKTQI